MNLHLPLMQGLPPPLVTLNNGGFETNEAWTQIPADKIIVECSLFEGSALGAGCGGKRIAWLGGTDSATKHSIAQTLALTRYYPVTVRFKYFLITPPTGCESDTFEVWLGSTRLNKTSLCGYTSPTWEQGKVMLPAIDGNHELKFLADLPGGVRSSVFIDDVSLCTTSTFKHPLMPACK